MQQTEIFDFPVETQALFTADGKKSSRKAVVRTDLNKIIGEVGANYKLVEHRPIFEKAEAFIKTFGVPEIRYSSINHGAKIVGTYTFKDITGDVKVGDKVGLQIIAVNTHDGSQSVKISLAGLRLSCLNGNSIRDSEFNAAYRHTGKNIENGIITDLILPQPEMLMGSFQGAFKDWRRWATIKLTESDMHDFRAKAIDEKIIASKILEGGEFEENTAWGLYNKFTWHISHREKETASVLGKMSRLDKVSKWMTETFA